MAIVYKENLVKKWEFTLCTKIIKKNTDASDLIYINIWLKIKYIRHVSLLEWKFIEVKEIDTGSNNMNNKNCEYKSYK